MSDLVLAAPLPRAAFRRHAIIAAMAFLTLVDLFAAQAILPSLARHYAVSPAAMGTAVNASTIGMAAACLAVAFLGHRIDRRRGIVLGLLLLAVPTSLLALAPDLASFAALRVVQGLCMATAFTLTLAHLGERCGAAEAAGAFAAYVTGNVASNLIGRLVSAGLADHLGLAANFLGFAALNLAGAALAAACIGPGEGAMPAMSGAWRGHLRDPVLRRCFAIGFCILFAFIGGFTYANFLLARPPFALSPMQIGFACLVFLPSIATTPLAGAAVARLGAPAVLLGGLGLAALALPLLLASSLAAVLLGLTLLAIGTFLAQATATGLVGRAAQGDRAAASGIYLASYFAGGIAGSALLGLAFEAFGWPGCVAGIGAALLLAGLAGLGLRPRG
ncbi:MFS transporter [Paracraurococcus lichenis]|uniref:MFS transporter n=1 Tax=Paracraurococcus lichenis TaxID=3064888 RepID=A0ABT9E7H6_9PROT|nr:MFS transporter [Paracraurococcus sp. LOR1-02]MDO9712151.1 MFS transporter [Paracraurococcus sp. LOR1-02]